MTCFKIYSKSKFTILERGSMGTIDLLNLLKTLKYGFLRDRKKINSNSTDSIDKVCKIQIDNQNIKIATGGLKAELIAECLEQIMVKYCKEIVGEVEELQGILKGKDLERYIDLMIQQNNSKSNINS